MSKNKPKDVRTFDWDKTGMIGRIRDGEWMRVSDVEDFFNMFKWKSEETKRTNWQERKEIAREIDRMNSNSELFPFSENLTRSHVIQLIADRIRKGAD